MRKLIFAIFVSAVFLSCNGGAGTQVYEATKMTLEEQEASNPQSFLTDKTTYRPALFGNKWVIEGTISNSATIVTYNNIVLTISFYDANNTLLGTNEYTINKSIPPNGSDTYKIKMDGYDNTTSIGVEILRASSK